ncbi:hypothetical protein IFR05_012622 [Cadophora sp. M221]|nr:hypothetical protein IFR05_012622 [Cadophora sp. M221]
MGSMMTHRAFVRGNGLDRPNTEQIALRWKREMDLISRRREVGLSSLEGFLAALDAIIHANLPTAIIGSVAPSAFTVSSNAALRLLDVFTINTASLRVHKTFTVQIFLFREFIFISLCQVAFYQGADRGVVYSIMRKVANDTGDKNLIRLLKGALWVNRVVRKFVTKPAGAGNPHEKIKRAGTEYLEPRMSFKRWTEMVAGLSKDWTDDQLETAAALSLLYGFTNVSSPQLVCTALGYNADSLQDYPRCLDNCRREHRMRKAMYPGTGPFHC